MTTHYLFHWIAAEPRRWDSVAQALAEPGRMPPQGAVYGLWRSQIGRPRDEVTAITTWSAPVDPADAVARWTAGVADIRSVQTQALTPTLRPLNATPPRRQGNYAFRWFETPAADWAEFLALCTQAWPGFESAYDSQVIGLWRGIDAPSGDVRSLLLTRRPNLAMWERSKLPQGEAEATVRDTLSRRYDLCTSTEVCTTTLITATDSTDDARWT